MRINHNIASLNTYRQLSSNSVNQSKSLEKLSSGLRINRAGDDAAGLAISEKMRGQIRGLDQASRNAQDGISMIQTAEGALAETHSILQRMKELATQAANDTNVTVDRDSIQKEINQLSSEINRIGNTTEFNTQKLLDGTKTKVADTAAVMTGSTIGGDIVLSASETVGTAKGTAVALAVTIHAGLGGTASSTNGPDLRDAALASSSIDITADNNELTLNVNGTTKTLILSLEEYDGADAGETSSALLADIESAITTAFGSDVADASLDANGRLVFTSKTAGAGTYVKVVGGDAATTLFGANWATSVAESNGADANNSLSIKITQDTGAGSAETEKTITIGNGTYTTMDNLVQAVNDAITADGDLNGKVSASKDGGALKLSTVGADYTGSGAKVEITGGTSTGLLGLNTVTNTVGNSASNEFTMVIDGETINVTMEAQTFTDKTAFAGALQAKINEATQNKADINVSITADNKLQLTSGTTGLVDSQVKLDASSTGFAAATGLTAGEDEKGTTGAGTAVNFQIGANQGQGIAVQIGDMRSEALKITSKTVTGDAAVATGVADAYFTTGKDVTNGTDNNPAEYALDVSSFTRASAAVKVFDNAIKSVSEERSKLGAYQNRLEHTINNLSTSAENLTAAESRIRDVDMAKEMMEFTKNNILSQAAQAMLAQANQQPQGVLQLLR